MIMNDGAVNEQMSEQKKQMHACIHYNALLSQQVQHLRACGVLWCIIACHVVCNTLIYVTDTQQNIVVCIACRRHMTLDSWQSLLSTLGDQEELLKNTCHCEATWRQLGLIPQSYIEIRAD